MKKVLITEDASFMRMSIKRMHNQSNYELFEAKNGRVALEMYKK